MTRHADPFPAHAIAIVGLAGRFPNASSLDDFWRNVREGVESLETFSEADLRQAGVDAMLSAAPAYVRKGTVLEGAELFDAGFFGLSPREAQILDPQQRIFLECAWEALEHAGRAADGSQHSVAVYAGAGMNTYLINQIARDPALAAAVGGYQLMLGNDKDFLCTRVSYKLDLHGPSVTIQTACSTSLVAVVMACQALARGECDLALAGGVSIPFPQRAGYLYEQGMILSPDGRCRPFDAGAAGTRPGSGCGIVVLKRLADAVADRDTIHAVIRGAAINNDGSIKAGYTAPSVDGQVEVIATAQVLAGVSPREIGYLETHGTATPLGDPIEIAALTQVFRASTADTGFCRLGALKANLGHLDAAAGVAGLIKTVLVLEHREIPPLLHFETPNPQLELETTPFMASAAGSLWASDSAPRRAGVSSFGIGGTNAHVVLEEAPRVTERPPARSANLLLLSAKSAAALEAMTSGLVSRLTAEPDIRMDDVAWTLQVGRRAFAHRRAVVVRDPAHALELLAQPLRSPVLSAVHDGGTRPVAFLFSGQGSQHAGMGAGLYAGESAYRDAVTRCAALLEPHLGLDIRAVLFESATSEQINQTSLAQPALFVTEYALACLWKSWGVEPAAMLGHSIGEYVAAHLAGVLSLEDALAVVTARGRLMQALPAGAMAAVHLPESELRPRLERSVEIAAINAPALCTISGAIAAVSELVQRLQASGVDTRALHTSHAFHSSMMEPVLQPFTQLLEGIKLAPPSIPYISNLTGTWITAEQATSPSYYASHLRHAVKFEAGLRTIAADPALYLLEVGPGDTLTTLARLTLTTQGSKRAIPSLARAGDPRGDMTIMREAAARLWLAGTVLDSAGMHSGTEPRRVPLPTYPFERKRYWVDAPSAPSTAAVRQHEPRLDDWLFAPVWSRDDATAPVHRRLSGNWLVCGSDDALTRSVMTAVGAAGATAILIERGAATNCIDGTHFVVRPAAAEDVAAVVEATHPAGVMLLWGVGSDALSALDVYDALIALSTGLGLSDDAASVQVLYASSGVESVLDEVALHPESAVALGPALVFPTEMPRLRLRCVDLELSNGALEVRAATDALISEANSAESTTQTAWRRGRRWLKRYGPISLPPVNATESPLKSRGVYLITGALGGIGLSLACWLGREFKARLLLTARSALPPRGEWDRWLATQPASERNACAIAAVRAIEADGGEVIVAAADVTQEADMSAALGAARERWGRIDGVIHAAGTGGPATAAAQQDSEAARAVFAPKVEGLELLVRLLGQTPLDFVALMSSVNSVLGFAGTCAYSSANAVLDAFAEGAAHPAAWRQVIAFNWGAWRDVGMAVKLSVPQARLAGWQAFVAAGIPTALGIEAFARGLASRRRRIIIEPHEPLAAQLGRRLPSAEPEAAAATEVQPSIQRPTDATPARPELSTAFDEPQSELERRLAHIWSQVLGIERVGRHDDFFELGGHSLLGTRVLAYIKQSIGAKLELREIFDSPTVQKMAQRIERDLAVATEPAAAEEREEIEF
jgi:phthiocerol/phenolphthiocerol synthesis type-I polyketide synthase E